MSKTSMVKLEEVKDAGKDAGLITLGLIAANALTKNVIKKDTIAVNGAITVVGILGAAAIENPSVKLICMGVAAYGALKVANNLIAPTPIAGVAGFEGLIPDSVKAKLAKFIPSFGNVDEEGRDQLTGREYEDTEDVNLDDAPYENQYAENSYEETVQGLGDATALLV